MSYPISVKRTTESHLSKVDFNNLPFGRNFSDHMFIADYYDGAWHDARIIPFENFSMHPATSAIHYGQALFEGLKAEKDADNNPIVFRPEKNWERLNVSAVRMAMPEVPKEMFMDALDLLLALDSAWIPTQPLSSLYIRPFLFATEELLGIRVAEHYRFSIICSPVGAYYSRPVKVYVHDKYTRAFPGGTGFAKAAGNYGATMMPAGEIQKQGYDQVLWLDGIEHKYFQEIGTMNVFFQIAGKLITPNLDGGTILAGVTRDSIIALAKADGITVEERPITTDEVLAAHANGTLEDMFGAGTAATVSHIGAFYFKGKDYELQDVGTRTLSNKLKQHLADIKSGKTEDTFNWLHRVPSLELAK